MRLPKGAAFGGEQGRNPSPNRAQDGAEGGDLFWLYYIDIYMIRVVEKKSRDNRMRVFHVCVSRKLDVYHLLAVCPLGHLRRASIDGVRM
jgi:hypothetical protein